MNNNTVRDGENDIFLQEEEEGEQLKRNQVERFQKRGGTLGRQSAEQHEPQSATTKNRKAIMTFVSGIAVVTVLYLLLKSAASTAQTGRNDIRKGVWGAEETIPGGDTDSTSAATEEISQGNSSDSETIVGYDEEFNGTRNAWTSWLHTLPGLMRRVNECDVALNKYKQGTYLYEMTLADCGGGYTLPAPNKNAKPWRVGLLGQFALEHEKIRELSGCEYGHSCPLHPTCEIVLAHRESALAHRMDVVVAVASEPHIVTGLPRTPHQIRVLYWREALWENTPGVQAQLEEFDLEMGVHYFAAINNPNFVLQPGFLLQGIIKPIPKSEFAASVMSDCMTRSHRHTYLIHLAAVLGPNRVHQYGRCGNRPFPKRPLQHGFAILSRYKFFFAFENTIQKGYTTEKLFETLLLPVVPVYYGDPDAPNITTTPSYIKASDFPNPMALAHYLLQLDRNPEEYERYHEWRKHPEPFQLDYLRRVAKLPGPREVLAANEGRNNLWGIRKAMCCRLCNEAFLREQMAARTRADVVTHRFHDPEIAQRFYGGGVHFDP